MLNLRPTTGDLRVTQHDSDMSREEAQALRRALKLLEQFEEYNPNMPIQIARAFLLTSLHEGRSLRELTDLSDQKLSTMSRHMLDLGERNRNMKEGYKLVEATVDPYELRKKQYRLTRRGRALKQRIVDILSPKKDQ